MTQELIDKINNACPEDQGIFREPSCIPTHIKEPVVYMRWKTGGVSGGSCWDSSNPQYYSNEDKEPEFKVLDLVLEELKPGITYLQYKKISALIREDENSEYEYYGNRTDYGVRYIILSELESLLNEMP